MILFGKIELMISVPENPTKVRPSLGSGRNSP